MTQEKIMMFFVVVVIVFFIFLFIKKEGSVENYQITYGVLGDQRKFYDRCVNDCFRNHTGDSGNSQFLWKCTDACQELSNLRMTSKIPVDDIADIDTPVCIQGIPDITDCEHQRHSECFNACDIDACYCLKDVRDFCRERVCFQSCNYEKCVESCTRVKSVDCTSGMSGGWRP